MKTLIPSLIRGVVVLSILAPLASGFALLEGCGGGSSTAGAGGAGTNASGGAGGAGGVSSTGGATSSGGVGGAGGGATGGNVGTGGVGGATVALPAGGDHFCLRDLTEAGAWPFGVQIKCATTFAKMPPLSADQKKALEYDCMPPFAKVAADCPHADAVAYCVSPDSPVLTTRTFSLVNKSTITPDTTAVALNGVAICSGTAYDLTGKALTASCKGTLKAKVDGTLVDFSSKLLCTYRSNGTKSEFFVNGQTAAQDKSININVHFEGGAYSVPGTEISPGVGYLEDNTTFPFPKDLTMVTVDVTKFSLAGGVATLSTGFSMGVIGRQVGGAGDARTITEGTADLMLTTP